MLLFLVLVVPGLLTVALVVTGVNVVLRRREVARVSSTPSAVVQPAEPAVSPIPAESSAESLAEAGRTIVIPGPRVPEVS